MGKKKTSKKSTSSSTITITLRTDKGKISTINDSPELRVAALAWSEVVRNRIRWNDTSGGIKRQRERCNKQLRELGITESAIKTIADRGIVEVSIPFVDGEKGWAARILPWEFLLSGATKEDREDKPLLVIRHLDTRRTVRKAGVGRPGVVISCPGKIGEWYDFTAEKLLAPHNLEQTNWPKKESPTLDELKAWIKKEKPDIFHFGGVDIHNGMDLLNIKELDKKPQEKSGSLDGVFLADEYGEPSAVFSDEFAQAINSATTKPRLAVFNVYHSAARTAALAVGHGTQTAIGFQDTFDDASAEIFLDAFYRSWRNSTADPLASFLAGWDALGDSSETLTGSGVVLWNAVSLVEKRSDATKSARETAEEAIEIQKRTLKFKTAADLRNALQINCKPLDKLNYSLLHNRQSMFKSFTISNEKKLEGAIEGVRVKVELYAGNEQPSYVQPNGSEKNRGNSTKKFSFHSHPT